MATARRCLKTDGVRRV